MTEINEVKQPIQKAIDVIILITELFGFVIA